MLEAHPFLGEFSYPKRGVRMPTSIHEKKLHEFSPQAFIFTKCKLSRNSSLSARSRKFNAIHYKTYPKSGDL